jgi:hypothetical protein
LEIRSHGGVDNAAQETILPHKSLKSRSNVSDPITRNNGAGTTVY